MLHECAQLGKYHITSSFLLAHWWGCSWDRSSGTLSAVLLRLRSTCSSRAFRLLWIAISFIELFCKRTDNRKKIRLMEFVAIFTCTIFTIFILLVKICMSSRNRVNIGCKVLCSGGVFFLMIVRFHSTKF